MKWVKLDAADKSTWAPFGKEVLVYIESLNLVIIARLVIDVGLMAKKEVIKFESMDKHVLDLDIQDVSYWAEIELPVEDVYAEIKRKEL